MATTQYITREGDRWDTVAHKAYGQSSMMKIVIRANPLVSISATLAGGVVLELPILAENTVKTDAEKLPPWKR